MANYLNKNNIRFKSDLKEKIFVDKSLLIKETNSVVGYGQSKFLCVTRPRRFGKTMALSMLNAYYSKGCDSKELFSNLKISTDPSFEEHLNKHNVIWIDMNKLYNISKDQHFLSKLRKNIISDLDEKFPNILSCNETYISEALDKVYDATSETFVFLIDEWDVVFRQSADENLKNNYIELLESLFKASDTSSCIDLVYMTGILPIKRYKNRESSLNNFDEYTMLESKPLSQFMGFTKNEIKVLCEQYNMDFDEMKRWYDGYNLNGIDIYNPKSVVNAIKKGEYSNYWVSTNAVEAVNDYLKFEEGNLYEQLLNLIDGKEEYVTISSFNNDIRQIHSKDAALTVLIHLGYLTYDGYGMCRIPNYEIKNELLKNLTNFDDSPYKEIIQLSQDGVNNIFNKDTMPLDKALSSNHKFLASNFNKTKEDVLSCVVLFTFIPLLKFYIQTKEVNTITGRADIIYIPKANYNKPPIIVELKVDKEPLSALNQIDDNGYTNALKGYHGKVIKIGINYDNKTLEHNTLIDEIEI